MSLEDLRKHREAKARMNAVHALLSELNDPATSRIEAAGLAGLLLMQANGIRLHWKTQSNDVTRAGANLQRFDQYSEPNKAGKVGTVTANHITGGTIERPDKIPQMDIHKGIYDGPAENIQLGTMLDEEHDFDRREQLLQFDRNNTARAIRRLHSHK